MPGVLGPVVMELAVTELVVTRVLGCPTARVFSVTPQRLRGD